MTYFIDTSALLALVNESDMVHDRAQLIWDRIRREEAYLFVTNYVLVETISLIQSRLGTEAARNFHMCFAPVLSVIWVNESTHQRAIELLLSYAERRLSLTDCSSFVVCREHQLESVFAFDKHFEREGFRLLTP